MNTYPKHRAKRALPAKVKLNPGRPKRAFVAGIEDEEGTVVASGEDVAAYEKLNESDPPAGTLLPRNVRVWVEGKIVLRDWDIEGHIAKDKLPAIFRALSFRALETGVADENSYLILREQPLSVDDDKYVITPQYRYGRLSSRRYLVDEVHDYLIDHPGLTIAEMAIGMFPDADVPAMLEPRIRQYLHRLRLKNMVSQRRDPGHNTRFFPVFIDRIPRDWDSRRRALAYELQDAWGGRLNDYLPIIKRLEILLDTQMQRITDPTAWIHPKDEPF